MTGIRWQLLLLVSFLLCGAHAGRVEPEQWTQPGTDRLQEATRDFIDGDDPDVTAHWALLAAGSAGWGNYRHQADVYHAYQVLLAGGFSPERIVVMAYDDIASDPNNPAPGKVFNRPGGPDVYGGVAIDYKGSQANAANFLAVLEGNAPAVANKGSGRVIASGPHDKVFVFYSDHGAAGVVGMPEGPFLYADQLIATLKRKHHAKGFKEIVFYIEACESGSMFEGLLGDDLAAYVTTAANAYESSWATYCPEFFGNNNGDTATDAPAAAAAVPSNALVDPSSSSSTGSWLWHKVAAGLAYLQHLLSHGTAADSEASSASAGRHGPPTPQLTTCLGDLYSVSWMEDAETSDLTQETLLQQYKLVKRRTSMNFTYEQGSHVMQYGALAIDREVAGDYQGMAHNGSIQPSREPSADWLEFEEAWYQQQQQQRQRIGGRHLLAGSSGLRRHAGVGRKHGGSKHSMLQRDADLAPLRYAAQHSSCPRKRAAAARELQAAVAARQAVDATAAAAVKRLVTHPAVGHILLANLGWQADAVLPEAHPAALQALYQSSGSSSSSNALGSQAASSGGDAADNQLLLGDVAEVFVQQLLGPLPGREGQALVDSWDCLRGFVEEWEGRCGQLDQYGMKQTRLFANLCNAGVAPSALGAVLAKGCAA